MFAVREEVEVLKEKIAELMDRINQLEVENTILKANASQETLSQLTTAANIVVASPQPTSVVTQQLQNSPALSKINDVLQATANISSSPQQQQQQPSQVQQQQQQTPAPNNPPSQQNPTATS
jgi:hypothetical protein